MQIVKNYDKQLVSEIALLCGDSQFQDFSELIYGQASFRSQREVAKSYDILKRKIEFVSETDIAEELLVKDFKAEYKVIINNIEYSKKTDALEEEKYDLYYNPEAKAYYIEYYNKAIGDNIEIYYTSIGLTSEEYDGLPVIPDQYQEEIIEGAALYIAKLGIAKYENEKKAKYQDLYRIYNRRQYDSRLAKDNSWIEVKPFIYP